MSARRSAASASLEEKVAFLREPGSYPGQITAVESVETHFAWVFLTSRHAWKLKKPISQGTMDYRSLARRQAGCRAELRLNRRLAPSVYQAVVPLRRRRGDGGLSIGGRGRIVDWLVKMRRLTADRMLDRALVEGTLRAGDIDRLVSVLARFFRRAQPAAMTGPAYLRRLCRTLAETEATLRQPRLRLGARRVDRAIRGQHAFLEHHAAHLAERASSIVEGHGDLRPEHVWLGSPVAVIDCLEFNRNLRLMDPAEEVAFLALECERQGRNDIAGSILAKFASRTAHAASRAILHFYMSQRALARAKVSAWHVGDPQFPVARPWIARAQSYLEDACRHARVAAELAASERPSTLRGPVRQQRSDRPTRQHASQRLSKQLRRRQDRQAAAG